MLNVPFLTLGAKGAGIYNWYKTQWKLQSFIGFLENSNYLIFFFTQAIWLYKKEQIVD